MSKTKTDVENTSTDSTTESNETVAVKPVLSNEEKIAKRNEASKLSKRKKRAQELGLTVEEYVATLVPLDAEAKRLRRNEQSRVSKANKRLKAKATVETPSETAE